MKEMFRKKNRGFTLIEVLISIAVLGVVTALSANIFTAAISSYNKANIINELEQNGNYAISSVTQKIRNSRSIVIPASSCGSICSGTTLVIENKIESGSGALCTEFGFVSPTATDNGYVFIEDSATSVLDITEAGCTNPSTSQYELTNRNQGDSKNGINVTNVTFTVDRSGGANVPATVKIYLDLEQGLGGSTRPEYQADIHLETTVSLRY